MELIFKKSNGEKQLVKDNISTKDEAVVYIKNFCKERNYQICYMREIVYEDYIKFDVGSYTDFFYLTK